MSSLGGRIPAIFFNPSYTTLGIRYSRDDNHNYVVTLSKDPLPIAQWTNVKIASTPTEEDMKQFRVRVWINNKLVHDEINKKPYEYNDVYAYASNPGWNLPAGCEVENIVIDSWFTPDCKEGSVTRTCTEKCFCENGQMNCSPLPDHECASGKGAHIVFLLLISAC